MVTAGGRVRRRSVERARAAHSQQIHQKAYRSSHSTYKTDSAFRQTRDDDGAFTPLAPLAVPTYLEAYGYFAATAALWKVPPGAESRRISRLDLGIVSHLEIDGHTWYAIECHLSMPRGADLKWKVYRRLQQLREHLHGHVKIELKEAYEQHFAEARFAHHGGLPGTTGRLHNWCRALAACVNSGKCPPSAVALVLHFMEAPSPELARFDIGAPAPEPLRSEDFCDFEIEVCLDVDDFEEPRRIETSVAKPITSRLPPPPPSHVAIDGPVPRTISRCAEDSDREREGKFAL